MAKRKKKKRIGGTADFIIGYIMVIALAAVFTLYANALTGWFIIIAFLLLPVFSLFYALYSSKMVRLEILPFEDIVRKGEALEVRAVISNRGALPTALLELEAHRTVTFSEQNERYAVYIPPFGSVEIAMKYNAAHWGEAAAGAESLLAKGMLGIAAFRVKNSHIVQRVGVMPDVAEIPSDSPIIKELCNLCTQNGDSEETIESHPSFNGMIGMEHREYTPGDPIKRINWKLSARADKLMVRLSDELAASRQFVVLDRSFDSDGLDEDERIIAAECAVESFLGILAALSRFGFDSVAAVFLDGGWVSTPIERYEDIEPLRVRLASFSFGNVGGEGRLPIDDIAEQGSAVICTPSISEDFAAVTSGLRETGDIICITSHRGGGDIAGAWLISGDAVADRL